ncbi:DinB family protein [Paludibaculum fermentans]|uniref:DinB family protein n=1 Tax=Paludibaculum fermentans TaxID=1473598 RepID=UPI003EB88B85
MMKIRIGTIACALAIMAANLTPCAQAQPAEQAVQAALAREAGTLSDKFTGLARVMAGKYDWKPGQGVRSAGDVFNLIVMENGLLASTLTGTAGGARPAPVTDPEKLQEALRSSYANLQKTITSLSNADLKAPVKLFGMDMTKEGAIRFLFGDQHEHLGQSIAYARSNGVVPPWSK